MPPMPMPMPPTGGAPPGMAPPGGTGAASAPQGMQGSGTQSVTAVKVALEALQKALPGLPMGSELHGAVLKAITDLSKHIEKAQGDSSAIIQQLGQLAAAARSSPQQGAMMRAMPPAPGAGAPPPPAAA